MDILQEEMMEAARLLKAGKASGLDCVVHEYIKEGGVTVSD